MKEWLSGFDGLAGAAISPASEDASFRRYFRIRTDAVSRIAMDAPPEREDSRPFVKVAGFLDRIGLNAPRVLEADLDRGFLLLTDLGSTSYLEELRRHPVNAAGLYRDALEALARMQSGGKAFQPALPPYDEGLLRFELSLFYDWLCLRYLRLEFAEADRQAWQKCCELLVDNAIRQPPVLVHRDFHSRNLMVTEKNNPGILDFQDAVSGPLTYDLVSLLKDCYISWPPERVLAWAMDFHSGLELNLKRCIGPESFLRAFELMGVQRQLKAAGIFARLKLRDGKASYMDDVPRTLGYILEIAPRYEELSFLARLIAERVLPGLRTHSCSR